MKQYVVQVACGCYITDCQITSNPLQYELTNSVEEAQRFDTFDSELVIKSLASEGETSEREEAEHNARWRGFRSPL